MRGLSPLRTLLEGRVARDRTDRVRVVLAAASLLQLTELEPYLERLRDPGLIRTPYLPGTPAPGAWLPALVTAAWAAAGLAALIGWRPRAACRTLAVVQVFVLLYDHQLYSNHFYLLTLLAVLLALAHPGAGAGGPAWPLFLMRTQLSSVYLFAGLAKIRPEFLGGHVLMHYLRDSPAPWQEVWRRPDVLGWVAVAVVATELFLAAGLWVPRTRRVAMAIGGLFHLSILIALGPSRGLVIFAMASLAVYPLFARSSPMPPDTVTG